MAEDIHKRREERRKRMAEKGILLKSEDEDTKIKMDSTEEMMLRRSPIRDESGYIIKKNGKPRQ